MATDRLSFVKKFSVLWVCFFLLIILLLSLSIGLLLGSMDISLSAFYGAVLYSFFGLGTPTDYGVRDTLWVLRLPRLMLAAFVGMGLALAGVVMQAIVRNPLADPYILGVSAGASLGASGAIFLGAGAVWGGQSVGVCAFIGALAAACCVVTVAASGKGNGTIRLLLAGMALSAVCSGLSGFIVYLGADKEGMQSITYWLMGSVANARWLPLAVLGGVVLLGAAFFYTQSRILNLMLLGESHAVTLGTNLRPYRGSYMMVCSLIVGFVVYNAGMVGFVGLIVPHIARSLLGANHFRILPIVVLLGGILTVWADIFCRTAVKGIEIPLGVMLALIGGPVFIYLMVRQSYKFEGGS